MADGPPSRAAKRKSLSGPAGRRIALRWLRLLVYLDAFRAAPVRFLTAAKWRLLGKRVRARGQFAPLLSLSPRSYRLWMMQQGAPPVASVAIGGHPPIIALVQGPGNDYPGGLARTLDCLASQSIDALIIDRPFDEVLSDKGLPIPWDSHLWFLPLWPGDVLAADGAVQYRRAIAKTRSRIVYADDDLVTAQGQRHDPHFKPDWNAPLFGNFDYLTGACLVRARAQDVQAVAQHADWAARLVAHVVAESAVAPAHLPAVIHHRVSRPRPRLPLALPAVARCLPPVSVIVPTRNRVDLLRICLDGLAATRYRDLEVIVVDNDSDDAATLSYLRQLDPRRHRIIHHAGPFNYSAINNRAVEQAGGDLICLLNNDIEIVDPDWLAIMATSALRADIGAVGARLLYPDGRIQHAGVVIGVGNAAGHAHRFVRPGEAGYFHRHDLPQFVSAVTAACLVVARQRFLAVGGLDEDSFPVAFNDVDLCLRLNAQGWQSFYEPRATLVHHESVSRGHDRDPAGATRLAGELAALQQTWGTARLVDPYHHPQLSRASETFVVAV
ncbi:glycosyltransferase family 2 protein [Novosphingobium sp. B-7]|uniref:glycosyltransferase family 2 protein n=1 Tax=Novosphingobium sp. B-7 TaxID=1298855 RepID=UPI0003B56E69